MISSYHDKCVADRQLHKETQHTLRVQAEAASAIQEAEAEMNACLSIEEQLSSELCEAVATLATLSERRQWLETDTTRLQQKRTE